MLMTWAEFVPLATSTVLDSFSEADRTEESPEAALPRKSGEVFAVCCWKVQFHWVFRVAAD